jgi:DNA-binding response OmpR family regulator
MSSAVRVLVVEDDPRWRERMRALLGARGFDVRARGSGADALAALAADDPAVVLLDLHLPGMDGFEICRRIRRDRPRLPILFVTSADAPQTRAAALAAGADDFLTKPVAAEDLAARIRGVLRRDEAFAGAAPGEAEASPAVLEVGELRIDRAARQVYRSGEPVSLSDVEFELLRELIREVDTVLTYEALFQMIWGEGPPDIRRVQAHVGLLRSKLERGPTGPRYLIAVPGVGYRFRLTG